MPNKLIGPSWRASLALPPAILTPPLRPPPPGDGAGILVAMPHIFMSEVAQRECGIELPPQVWARRVTGCW